MTDPFNTLGSHGMSDKKTAYLDLIQPTMNTAWHKTADAAFFGKRSKYRCVVKLFINLWFFLDIIEQHRQLDAANGGDEGNDYYIAYYCTNLIQSQLICRGLTGKLVRSIFDLYGLLPTISTSSVAITTGIGNEEIEGTPPFNIHP